MPAFKDLTGQQFGKLVVVGPHPVRTDYNMIRWICRCECGNEKLVTTSNLGRNTHSCGCHRNTQGSLSNKHPLWAMFDGMHKRCEKPSNRNYKHYGARGIKVCPRWESFPLFLEDMEPTYRPGLSIERNDVNGDYEPKNCRWATTKEQSRNKRKSIFIDTPWGRMNVADAAERIGMDRCRFKNRVKRGWTTEQLFDPRYYGKMTRRDGPNVKTN